MGRGSRGNDWEDDRDARERARRGKRRNRSISDSPARGRRRSPTPKRGRSPSSSLPRGWERRETDKGKVYFVDHNTQRTCWEHPGKQKNKGGKDRDGGREVKRERDSHRDSRDPPRHRDEYDREWEREGRGRGASRAARLELEEYAMEMERQDRLLARDLQSRVSLDRYEHLLLDQLDHRPKLLNHTWRRPHATPAISAAGGGLTDEVLALLKKAVDSRTLREFPLIKKFLAMLRPLTAMIILDKYREDMARNPLPNPPHYLTVTLGRAVDDEFGPDSAARVEAELGLAPIDEVAAPLGGIEAIISEPLYWLGDANLDLTREARDGLLRLGMVDQAAVRTLWEQQSPKGRELSGWVIKTIRNRLSSR